MAHLVHARPAFLRHVVNHRNRSLQRHHRRRVRAPGGSAGDDGNETVEGRVALEMLPNHVGSGLRAALRLVGVIQRIAQRGREAGPRRRRERSSR